ncbi:hypothetical protein NV379_08770 [Paenibacillus sp. N1-5-1-14]|uniref:hypothetical protein n=1 Tax=Paenibacillus radicibacter TaxID=2972488 RepID=UPI002158CFF2|nr:hypothetical protein [Paenibacillus radicibacter]MCR8642755.1 hypothetical protein [Paenibacillus radicibacter]
MAYGHKVIRYSTSPVENAKGISGLPGTSVQFFAKALNNSKKKATITFQLFRLNGQKVLLDTQTFTLAPGSSGFRTFDVSQLFQFEVVFTVSNCNVLVSGWGKNKAGQLVAAHRFAQAELTRF